MVCGSKFSEYRLILSHKSNLLDCLLLESFSYFLLLSDLCCGSANVPTAKDQTRCVFYEVR